jgi:UDP-2-acetamido-3-amino-2,3-dideoxy-glucuronate N-acetyltransferase
MNYFAHSSTFIDEGCEIGAKTKIWHFCHIQTGARIGESCVLGQNVNIASQVKIGNFVKIQNNVSVYEGVELDDYVFCGPSVVFTNVLNPRSEFPQKGIEHYHRTLVRRGATIGANATVVCGITIGKFAFIGAGAVVTKDVPDYAVVLGNPARLKGWMCRCAHKIFFIEDRADCARCSRKYQRQNELVQEIECNSGIEKILERQ